MTIKEMLDTIEAEARAEEAVEKLAGNVAWEYFAKGRQYAVRELRAMIQKQEPERIDFMVQLKVGLAGQEWEDYSSYPDPVTADDMGEEVTDDTGLEHRILKRHIREEVVT